MIIELSAYRTMVTCLWLHASNQLGPFPTSNWDPCLHSNETHAPPSNWDPYFHETQVSIHLRPMLPPNRNPCLHPNETHAPPTSWDPCLHPLGIHAPTHMKFMLLHSVGTQTSIQKPMPLSKGHLCLHHNGPMPPINPC